MRYYINFYYCYNYRLTLKITSFTKRYYKAILSIEYKDNYRCEQQHVVKWNRSSMTVHLFYRKEKIFDANNYYKTMSYASLLLKH